MAPSIRFHGSFAALLSVPLRLTKAASARKDPPGGGSLSRSSPSHSCHARRTVSSRLARVSASRCSPVCISSRIRCTAASERSSVRPCGGAFKIFELDSRLFASSSTPTSSALSRPRPTCTRVPLIIRIML